MYERKENIPEENLDWGEGVEKVDQPVIEQEGAETKHIIHPATEHNKITLKKKVKFSQINIKRKILDLLDEHTEISMLLILLVTPYLVGFIIVAFILLSGGVPIDRFFSLKEGIFHFELWSIGTYIFITVSVIWLVILLFKQSR